MERSLASRFVLEGGRPLNGRYRVQGNKNAALPLIAASLAARSRITLHNVPRIVDVENMLALLQACGAGTRRHGQTVIIDSTPVRQTDLHDDKVEKLRGAILLLGALAPSAEELHSGLPGGCPIGRRSFDVHWSVFEAAGFAVEEDSGVVRIERRETPKQPSIYLEEASVTATENALILFAGLGKGVIQNPAREPHVLSLVEFLRRLGCEIVLHPLYWEVKSPLDTGRELEFRVPGDYIDAGTVAIATAVTGGKVQLSGISGQDMLGIAPVLARFGIRIEADGEDRWTVIASRLKSPPQVTAGLWPLFPTDLVSLAIVLATQSEGLCLVHDWMYEARMFFVDKLVRMGAGITMCDPHRVLVHGVTPLRATRLESPDIRAGMALVVAGLCARGQTVIEHAEVIQRGYQTVAQRLAGIGASISEI